MYVCVVFVLRNMVPSNLIEATFQQVSKIAANINVHCKCDMLW